ncbi:MAG: hypothetical protein Q8916_11615, partial [Bacteroidota bacterium]|nr:hypothetical protein [Bacteroidota bacterium]
VILSRLDSIADVAYPPSGKSAEEAIISELSGGILVSLGGVFLLALGLLAALGGWYDLACRAFEERAMPLGRILGSTLTWSMWMLLAQIAAIILSIFIALGIIVGVASVISPVLGALSFFASIVCMIYAGVRLMFCGVALVSEESGPIAAIKRSLALTQGIFWRVIGISLICGTTIYIISAIIQTPLSMAINGDIRWLLEFGRGNMSISQLLGNLKQTIRDLELVYIISSALTAIFFPAFLATFYYDLRTRKEGPLEYPEPERVESV